VHLAFGGHVDDDIALHGGLAAEAPALLQAAHAVIAFLDRVPFRQRVGRDGDAVLGEIAVGWGDLAFRADAAPAADAVEIDAELARGGQDGVPTGKRPRLPEGVKMTRGLLVRHGRDSAIFLEKSACDQSLLEDFAFSRSRASAHRSR
jgi:hypothetical protein